MLTKNCHAIDPETKEICGKPVTAVGLCAKHYTQLQRGRLGAVVQKQSPPGEAAEVTVRCGKDLKFAIVAEAARRTTPEREVSPSELWREAAAEWLNRRGIKVAT
jgi:hypothetical protein